jgi:hypothetical protein
VESEDAAGGEAAVAALALVSEPVRAIVASPSRAAPPSRSVRGSCGMQNLPLRKNKVSYAGYKRIERITL